MVRPTFLIAVALVDVGVFYVVPYSVFATASAVWASIAAAATTAAGLATTTTTITTTSADAATSRTTEVLYRTKCLSNVDVGISVDTIVVLPMHNFNFGRLKPLQEALGPTVAIERILV